MCDIPLIDVIGIDFITYLFFYAISHKNLSETSVYSNPYEEPSFSDTTSPPYNPLKTDMLRIGFIFEHFKSKNTTLTLESLKSDNWKTRFKNAFVAYHYSNDSDCSLLLNEAEQWYKEFCDLITWYDRMYFSITPILTKLDQYISTDISQDTDRRDMLGVRSRPSSLRNYRKRRASWCRHNNLL